MSGGYTFYDQQIEMSERILSTFTNGEGELYGLLLAQMQSGKSGTYFHLALDSVHRGFFDKVYIICGSRDTSLRDQTKDGLSCAIESFCSEKATDFRQGMTLMRKFQQSVQVFWNQELDDVTVCDRCLIINDESHTASSKTNIPYKKFWKKAGLSTCLHGDFSALRDRDIRVLSVSATSFSECVENQKVTLGIDVQQDIFSAKNVFIMDPGPTYTGVPHFLRNENIIFASQSISEKTNGCHLRAVLLDEKYARKYCIVRTARAALDTELVKDIADRAGVIYKPVHSDKITESLEFLSTVPRHTTLVHICGIARMGQELDKTHIGFVYEQSKNPAIDTLLQGLLGRVCGHNANPDIDIYVSAKREREVREYATAVELSAEECVAAFARIGPALNVKSGGGHKHSLQDTTIDKSGNFWRKMIPIKFPYSILGSGFDSREITHEDLLSLFQEHPELLDGNPDKQFIMSELEFVHHADHLSNLDLSRPSYSKNNLEETVSQKKRSFQFGAGSANIPYSETHNVIPFYALYDKSSKKDVYFTGFAPDTTMTRTIWDSQIGMNSTLKKCNFNPAHVAVTEAGRKIHNVNGGQLIVFPRETSEDEVLFCEELRKAIQRSKDNSQIQCEVSSVWCMGTKEFKGIRLSKRVFDQEKLDSIKKKLQTEFSIKLKFTKTRGRQPTDWFQFSSISW
jgi:hypothetical protein